MRVKCDKKTKFEDCELAILRAAVDNIEMKTSKEKLQNDTIKKMIQIVEEFIAKTKCVCYGGTAINNILPIHDQFYNKNVEFPDYDFYSPNALEHAKKLAEEYYKQGYEEVEAKAGLHTGTYKVFVNFLPVADITQMDNELFKNIQKESITIQNILYCPPNFLRMAMYLELSRPKGDVSRWEKVLKRITLLNKHYPLKSSICSFQNVQRIFENQKYPSEKIFHIVKNIFIQEQVVFFGAMAHRSYSHYMPEKIKCGLKKIPDFDVLSENPEHTMEMLKSKLQDNSIKNVTIKKHMNVGEIISTHYELKIDNDTVAFVYEPLSCHSYNVFTMKKQRIRIATIDTMLSFYLAFLYSNRPYYNVDRILCMCEYLFKVQERNRLSQNGLLRRFSMKCIGYQKTMEDIRSHKSDLYNSLKQRKSNKEYEKHFLKYTPNQPITKRKTHRKVVPKTTKKTMKTTGLSRILSWLY